MDAEGHPERGSGESKKKKERRKASWPSISRMKRRGGGGGGGLYFPLFREKRATLGRGREKKKRKAQFLLQVGGKKKGKRESLLAKEDISEERKKGETKLTFKEKEKGRRSLITSWGEPKPESPGGGEGSTYTFKKRRKKRLLPKKERRHKEQKGGRGRKRKWSTINITLGRRRKERRLPSYVGNKGFNLRMRGKERNFHRSKERKVHVPALKTLIDKKRKRVRGDFGEKKEKKSKTIIRGELKHLTKEKKSLGEKKGEGICS